jgi:hypothetical protein
MFDPVRSEDVEDGERNKTVPYHRSRSISLFPGGSYSPNGLSFSPGYVILNEEQGHEGNQHHKP